MRQMRIERFGYLAMAVVLMVGWGLLTGWTQEQSPAQSCEETKVFDVIERPQLQRLLGRKEVL